MRQVIVSFQLFVTMSHMTKLVEGRDYYFNELDQMVFTKEYLIARGHCCKSACTHCPYGFTRKADPELPQELVDPWKSTNEEDIPEIYDQEIPEDEEL